MCYTCWCNLIFYSDYFDCQFFVEFCFTWRKSKQVLPLKPINRFVAYWEDIRLYLGVVFKAISEIKGIQISHSSSLNNKVSHVRRIHVSTYDTPFKFSRFWFVYDMTLRVGLQLIFLKRILVDLLTRVCIAWIDTFKPRLFSICFLKLFCFQSNFPISDVSTQLKHLYH